MNSSAPFVQDASRLVLAHRGILLMLVTLGIVAPPAPSHAQTAGSATRVHGTSPVLATEDSIRQYELPEPIRVHATRVPLLDIIRRAQQGELHKYDGLSTLTFTRIVKVTIEFGKPKARTETEETVSRVYFRAPDRWKEAEVRRTETVIEPDGSRRPKDKEKDKDGVQVEVNDDDEDTARSLVRLPDYLERLDHYNFEILHRSVQPEQVVYEVGFRPKSEFDMLPEGRMWILTRGYQIVREELHFAHLPMPGILKGVDLITREWQEVDGRWLLKRISARATLGLPGILRAPKSIEAVVVYGQYVVNPTLDPALFGEAKP